MLAERHRNGLVSAILTGDRNCRERVPAKFGAARWLKGAVPDDRLNR